MAVIATGITVAFSSSFFAEMIDVSGPNVSREAVQTSHQGTTTAHTHIPSKLADWGEVTIDLAFDPATKPPINSDPETITITWPNSTASVWAFTGFMTGFEITGTLEERMTASATLKASGDCSVT